MKILVIGGGGREHAIIKKLNENKNVSELYAAPGNGGIAKTATCINIRADDFNGIVDFSISNAIDLVVVAPDNPLVDGLVDLLNSKGIRAFGPNKRAAIIEGSKGFSKELMKKYGIPTAKYEIFNNESAAKDYIVKGSSYPIVIKADGLALGKGVVIANSEEEALSAISSIMNDKVFGESGNEVVIEEFLTGPEVTVLSFTDGNTIVPMISSMDHKRAKDGDLGLNTGGMGVIAPNPFYTKEISDICMEIIFIPTINAMKEEGRPFKGCLYFGLMLTNEGPKVIEYNCRFGDPEAQTVLPLLKTDLLEIFEAIIDDRLNDVNVEFDDKSSCCVIAASGGYPEKYKSGCIISGLDKIIGEDVFVYHSGTKSEGGNYLTNGGRVLCVQAKADNLEEAVANAYNAVEKISFENCYYRKDIGKKALGGLK